MQSSTNEHYHCIEHTRISVATSFHLKQKVLIFWSKFAQKGYSSPKQGK